MFNHNDKITLTASNFINKQRNIVNINLSFPIKEDFDLPEDIIQVGIFEMQQGQLNLGFSAFSIHVGKITTINECANNINNGIKYELCPNIIENSSDIGLDDKLCYYTDNEGKNIVFGIINESDIVVNDTKELKKVLLTISNNYKNILDAIDNIKNINKEKEYVKSMKK